MPRLRPLSLVMVICSALLGVASAPTPPADAQTLEGPERPLLLIGGTFADSDFAGYDPDLDYEGYDRDGDGVVEGDVEVGGWPDVIDWLSNYGYVAGENLFVGQMATVSGPPPNWSSSPMATGYCGDHWQWNGTRWQWTGPLSSCNGWTWDEFVKVIQGPDGPGGLGGSTAGAADMNTSVQTVRAQILLVWAVTGGQQIDVAAHSQGAAIVRAAIKQLEAEATAEDQDGDGVPGHHDIVHTMVSLGGAHYGIPVTAPEFWIAGWGWYAESVLRDCRNDGWLPVCPDIVRDYSDSTGGIYLRPNPYNPGSPTEPFNTDHPYWGLIHRTPFYPNLNALTGDGPTPGNTIYHHLYSSYYPVSGAVGKDVERIELHDDGPNVENRSVQDFCGDPNYPVDHVAEWVHPAMHELILDALGIREADPTVC